MWCARQAAQAQGGTRKLAGGRRAGGVHLTVRVSRAHCVVEKKICKVLKLKLMSGTPDTGFHCRYSTAELGYDHGIVRYLFRLLELMPGISEGRCDYG